MDFVETCPPYVVQHVRSTDLATEDGGALFSWIENEAPGACQFASIAAVADRMDERSHPTLIRDLCSNVAAYARFMDAETRARIEAAYRRIPYSPDYALQYFLGLRMAAIDIRDHLQGRIAEDWSFTDTRSENSATWHYYMYMASLGSTDALNALADKIAGTEDGHQVSHFLLALNDLPGEGVTEILRLYSDDSRRESGMNGPGMMISENVEWMLRARAGQP